MKKSSYCLLYTGSACATNSLRARWNATSSSNEFCNKLNQQTMSYWQHTGNPLTLQTNSSVHRNIFEDIFIKISFISIESYTKIDCQDGQLHQTFAFYISSVWQADVFSHTLKICNKLKWLFYWQLILWKATNSSNKFCNILNQQTMFYW